MDKLNIYEYNIITDPNDPDSGLSLNEILSSIQSDDFRILEKNFNIYDKTITFYYFKVVVPEEITGVSSSKRLRIEELITNINYHHLFYSLDYELFDDNDDDYSDYIINLSPSIKILLEDTYDINIDNIQVSKTDKYITFTPIDKNGRMIYVKNIRKINFDTDSNTNSDSNIDGTNTNLDILLKKIYISNDPLTPYAISNKEKLSDYSTNSKLFLFNNRNQKINHFFEIDYLRDRILKLREDGYISFPPKYFSLTKHNINIGGEVILEFGGYLERVDPYIISKFSPDFLSYPTEKWLLNTVERINNEYIPKITIDAPKSWIRYTNEDYDKYDDITTKIEFTYGAIKSYLELSSEYNELYMNIRSINIINKRQVQCCFYNLEQLNKFKEALKINLNMIQTTNLINYSIYYDYDYAISWKWYLQKYNINGLIVNSGLINNSDNDKIAYYLIYLKPKGIEIPIIDDEIVYKNCINALYIHYQKYSNDNILLHTTTDINKKQIDLTNKKGKLSYLLEMFPITSNNNSNETLMHKNDFDIIWDIYINPSYNNLNDNSLSKIYKYSMGIKYYDLIINGYFNHPTGFVKGILNVDPIYNYNLLSSHHNSNKEGAKIDIGKLLLTENEISENFVMYQFEIAVNYSDYYIPNNNSEIISRDFKKIESNLVSTKLFNQYRSDLSNLSSKYIPSDDPGKIIYLFELILPINTYDKTELYNYVNNIWKQGYFLSLWSKYIYKTHNKISYSNLSIPNFLIEASENTTKSVEAINKINNIII